MRRVTRRCARREGGEVGTREGKPREEERRNEGTRARREKGAREWGWAVHPPPTPGRPPRRATDGGHRCVAR
eukprot:4580403-Prymnesium_polylepis.1